MEISIRDIGVVHKADIRLDGLTVIAGENGVGKSAIGKALYCFTQSIVKLSEHSSNDILKRFTSYLFQHIDSADRDFLKNLIDPENKYYNKKELQNILLTLRNKYPDLAETWQNNDKNRTFSFDHRMIVAEAHDQLIQSVFGSSYHNKLSNKKESLIEAPTLVHKEQTIFHINDNKSTLGGIFSTKYLGSPIVIETPLTLSNYQYIKENLAFNNQQNALLPDYTKKLIRKLSESSYNPDYTQPLCKTIQDIIQGQILIENDQLFYKDKKENKHPIQSVATGIKSLGMLQLLVAGGAIKEDTILIIDEPEIHLHPSWQLAYAKIIVELVKEGINVLITSHSSTFIEALKVYSENEGVNQKTNFYLGKMTEKGSVFEEVTESLEPIYKAFAAPSLELMLEKSRGKYQKRASAGLAQEQQAPYSTKDKQDF